jgi:2,3-bisphosphoglycerate-dependent phosphoglycerate mutase
VRHRTLASFLVIRHAESPWSPDEMRPLSASGHDAAEAMAKSLSAFEIAAIYSSPYLRAIQTIEPLANYLELPIHEIDDLRERTLGSTSGIRFEDAVAATFSDFDLLFPGGESSRAAQRRAVHTMDRLIEAHPSELVAISTHGNLLSLLLNAFSDDVGFEFWRSLALPDVFQLRLSSSGNLTFERLATCAT